MSQVKLGKRKICMVDYSRTLTLPKVWLANSGVDVNDYVELLMMPDRSLLIRPTNVGNLYSSNRTIRGGRSVGD